MYSDEIFGNSCFFFFYFFFSVFIRLLHIVSVFFFSLILLGLAPLNLIVFTCACVRVHVFTKLAKKENIQLLLTKNCVTQVML